MTDMTTENLTGVEAWPMGAQVEQTDAGTWVWTGKKIAGKWVLVHPSAAIHNQWYRLHTTDEMCDYTWLSHRDNIGIQQVDWMFRAAQMAETRQQELRANQRIRSDWKQLNELLNEYADNQSMCGEYESKLDEWNGCFSEMSLTGREKTYEVEVTITAKYTNTVEVTATSKEAAEEAANDLDWEQVMQGLYASDVSDCDWEVESVEVQ